ncbi:family 16 glycosylhydrolase [Frankia sp. ACN1ag]|uniref:glycoside hydrolase family 16 protein n=1 Tax=Frankia sp. ACN1ag TaxID=102891 RepID=UPI0009FB04B3|nr:glycoside hydrolase family 16 protein [Frankia sp. ACN1ag]
MKGSSASLLFDDDFIGETFDPRRWKASITGLDRARTNGEAQAYLAEPQTIAVKDGHLSITSRYHAAPVVRAGDSYRISSGFLSTEDRFSFQYGLLEVRARLPAGLGFWPAIWLEGVESDGLKWPDVGELDLMENIGDPTWISAAVHGPGLGKRTPFIKRHYFSAADDVTAWHTYGTSVQQNGITFSVDGKSYLHVSRQDLEARDAWVFSRPKYIILNLALGGSYPASVNHYSEPFYGVSPHTLSEIKAGEGVFEVDWVRVSE